MIYLFCGTDEFSRDEQVESLRSRMRQDPMGDLNLSVFDGRETPLQDMRSAWSSLPFMSDRRMVIVFHLLRHQKIFVKMESSGEIRSTKKVKVVTAQDHQLARPHPIQKQFAKATMVSG